MKIKGSLKDWAVFIWELLRHPTDFFILLLLVIFLPKKSEDEEDENIYCFVARNFFAEKIG